MKGGGLKDVGGCKMWSQWILAMENGSSIY